MKANMAEATFEGKESVKIPSDATIIKNDFRITVKEIENGFVIRKNYDIKWTDTEGENHYEYFSKEWYSKENPMKIDEKLMGGKDLFLADKFE